MRHKVMPKPVWTKKAQKDLDDFLVDDFLVDDFLVGLSVAIHGKCDNSE